MTIAFVSDAFTVDEGESATITVTVTPAADRNVTVTTQIHRLIGDAVEFHS